MNIRQFFLVLGVLIPAASGAGAAGQSQPKEPAHYSALLETVWRTVDERFYDPAFNGVDWKSIGARYRSRVGAVHNDQDFFSFASTMVRELKSSHVDILMPRTTAGGGASIAAKIERIGGQSVVTAVAPLSDARRKGLVPGDILRSSSAGPLGAEAEVTAESCTGEVKKLRIRRESAFWPPVQPTFQWSTITVGPDKTIGYLRIDGFGDDGAELADRAMKDLEKAQAIVLDVRNNPGGNASALRLASYFTEGEQPALGLLTRDWLKRLNGPARPQDVLAAPRLVGAYTTAKVFEGLSRGQGGAMLWTEDMGAKRWTKPVALLIGENSGSAAEGFAWLMKLKTKAKLIGRPTAGALLGSEVVDVGSGWSVRVPVHGIWAPDGVDYGDRPVPPEITVTRTRKDICAARDPDLEKALDLLSQ